jgi:hypothetical protein
LKTFWRGRAAYQQLLAAGTVDRCGLTTLAGKAVGAPFVGTVAATLVISELLRLLHGGTIDSLIDLDLRSVEHRHVVPQGRDYGALNPGYVRAVCGPPDTAGLRVRAPMAHRSSSSCTVPTAAYRDLVPTSVPSANRKKGWSVGKEDAKI